VLFLQAGPEVAVAASKTFVTQVTLLVMLAATIAKARGTLAPELETELGHGLRALPGRHSGPSTRGRIRALARRYVNSRGFMFIGRGVTYPTRSRAR